MKPIIFSIITLFILSCNNETIIEEPNNIDTIEDNQTKNNTIKDSTINEVVENIESKSIEIEDIPKKWYKLNLQESKQYTINEWCEIQSIQLEIEKNGNDGWQILVSYPTDSRRFKIIGFEASETATENETIISGNFIIENPDYPDLDPDIYSFYWNKGMMHATFSGFFNEDTRMVSELNKHHYELVKENCDYLDEDEER
jgi:hypothetical protein